MSGSNCCFLIYIQISQETGKVVWYSHPLKNFPVCGDPCSQMEKAMAHHSSSLAWKIPWTEQCCSLQSMGSQRVRHDWATSLSLASKVILNILQARLQQYVNQELPDVQAGFRKGRGTRDQIANIHGSSKKQESSRKISTSALLTTLKPLTMWITTNCGKFFKGWEYQTTLPVFWEICMEVKKQYGHGH